ncbi:MAG: SDR family oxidoreductase [Alphaproteobacteria bacterium]|nr:SDR family oxidoreductase [Alphaproteobacteria bacterium]
MIERLQGKTAIVTGAGRGYGASMARALAREGANVVLASRSVGECQNVAADIEANGRPGRTLAIAADVVDDAAVQRMVDATVKRFGGIDILVNNAGYPGTVKPFADLNVEDWDIAYRVNLGGTIACSKAALPHMIKPGGGRIINISSLTAQLGFRFFRSFPYTVSKYAVTGLSFTMAVKLEAQNIRVYALMPGLAITRFVEDAPHGFFRGMMCQEVWHIDEPLLHLLTTDEVPSGEAFNAVEWLEKNGKLAALSYLYETRHD